MVLRERVGLANVKRVVDIGRNVVDVRKPKARGLPGECRLTKGKKLVDGETIERRLISVKSRQNQISEQQTRGIGKQARVGEINVQLQCSRFACERPAEDVVGFTRFAFSGPGAPEVGRKASKSTAPVKTIKKLGVVLPISNTPPAEE